MELLREMLADEIKTANNENEVVLENYLNSLENEIENLIEYRENEIEILNEIIK